MISRPRRAGDMAQSERLPRGSVHENCTAHSGLSVRVNIILVLTGVATIGIGFALAALVNIQSLTALNRQTGEYNRDRVAGIERAQESIKSRIRALENGNIH